MHHLRAALETTTAHGLSRLVTGKPLYVRVAWLLLFCVTMALFLRGFVEFVGKLRSNPATNSLEVNGASFQFPDVYVCFENPISGSYAANLHPHSAAEINNRINRTFDILSAYSFGYGNQDLFIRGFSFVQPHSLPYQLLVDTLGKRHEQSILVGGIVYKDSAGMPHYRKLNSSIFYHPIHLGCAKFVLSGAEAELLGRSGANSGLLLKVLLDENSSYIPANGAPIRDAVYTMESAIPVSDWSLSSGDLLAPDRASGLRIYLAPPGEYPTDFVTSFSLGPGKYHTVEIDMKQQEYKAGQFDCLSPMPDVQFLNPYHRTPYNHSYSYSYCFYYEYQSLYQRALNMSGDKTPMPWELRHKDYMFNVTSTPNVLDIYPNSELMNNIDDVQQHATKACESKRPCSTIEYSVRISSSDWPTQGSLIGFVNSTVGAVWLQAKMFHLDVPVLDFLFNGSDVDVLTYLRKNLLKVFFKPKSLQCDKVSFSRDYGVSNFISDVGGIMGIYLGMSILTLCEVFELIYDLISYCNSQRKAKSSTSVAASSEMSVKTLH